MIKRLATRIALAAAILTGGVGLSTAAECVKQESTALPVSICLDPDGWALADIGSEAEMEFSTPEQDLFMMVITEADYFDQPTLRKAILTNAQLAAKLNKIEVVEDETVTLSGQEVGRLVYIAKLDDIVAHYENYYTGLEGKGSLQIVLFTLDQPISDFSELIKDVTDSLEIEG